MASNVTRGRALDIGGTTEPNRGFPEAGIGRGPDGHGAGERDATDMRKKSVIVGVDGSEGSCVAVDEALRLAGDLDALVTFVFVRKPPPALLGNPYYERALKNDIARAGLAIGQAVEVATRAGIEADSEILEGDAADELVSFADNRDADLIVVGSRGFGPLAGAVLGSVSRSVSQHANRPVVVAKQTQARAQVEQLQARAQVA
jgi:nucleotide-binding universal stress UspA family protein